MKILTRSFFGFLLLVFLTASNPTKKLVVIDVSHGGEDHGVVVEMISEKDIALQIAERIVELNKNDKLEIRLSRNADDFLSLEDRTKLVNEQKPDLVISLHMNQFYDSEIMGTEIYYSELNKDVNNSKQFAENLHNAIHPKICSVKTANFDILKKVNSPAILVEMGFMSNEHDRNWLRSPKGQEEMALNILKALN